jgi:hypothetical protein
MKRLWIVLAIAGVVLSPELALASKSKTNCTEKQCVKETKLSPWESHEFRGACEGQNYPNAQYCSPNGQNVTCTISVKSPTSNYWSCSCTNWSVSAKHKASATIICKGDS